MTKAKSRHREAIQVAPTDISVLVIGEKAGVSKRVFQKLYIHCLIENTANTLL
jgi:transcriptional regulator with PAS, ATPase and Fis domain